MATDIISAYQTVCIELEGLEAYALIARMRLKQDYNVMYKGKMPSSEMCYVPLTTSIPTFNEAVKDYNETMDRIEKYRVAKVQMEQLIAGMSDVEKIIITLHVKSGLSLREIAEKSNYSYGHLRNIAGMLRKQELKIS